jgi:two-component system OmpR family response regulator
MAPPASAHGLPGPVLVVEDDAGVREFLVSELEHHGYRVVASASAEDAFARLGEESARLAILDVGLPGQDGFAVADRLAAGVPVIIVTGDPVRAYAAAGVRNRRYQVLPKPVAPELLEHAVAEAL